jgi:hypothetical protein
MKFNINLKGYVTCSMALMLCLLLLCPLVYGDHNPENEISKGRAENRLANIILMKSKLADVIKIYGKPSRIESDEYYWQHSDWTMRLIFETPNDPVVNIDVRGRNIPKHIGVTGSGLKIGDSLLTLRKIYGTRYDERNLPNIRIHDVMIEWEEGVSLVAEMDAAGKIVSLSLSAPE